MQFEWDPDKAAANLKKHGVSFEFAIETFSDRLAIEKFDDRYDYGEDRFIRIGQARGMLLTVVCTDNEQITRIISARRAVRNEQDQYHCENAI